MRDDLQDPRRRAATPAGSLLVQETGRVPVLQRQARSLKNKYARVDSNHRPWD